MSNDASASFQAAVIDILLRPHRQAHGAVPREFPAARTPPGGGGRRRRQSGDRRGSDASWRESQDFDIRIPPPRLCTDNAAMIAWAGLERLRPAARPTRCRIGPGGRWPLAA